MNKKKTIKTNYRYYRINDQCINTIGRYMSIIQEKRKIQITVIFINISVFLIGEFFLFGPVLKKKVQQQKHKQQQQHCFMIRKNLCCPVDKLSTDLFRSQFMMMMLLVFNSPNFEIRNQTLPSQAKT